MYQAGGTGPFSFCSLRFILRAGELWCLGNLLCRQLLPGWGQARPLAEDNVLNRVHTKHPPSAAKTSARDGSPAEAPSCQPCQKKTLGQNSWCKQGKRSACGWGERMPWAEL